jgi:hypothetical protein
VLDWLRDDALRARRGLRERRGQRPGATAAAARRVAAEAQPVPVARRRGPAAAAAAARALLLLAVHEGADDWDVRDHGAQQRRLRKGRGGHRGAGARPADGAAPRGRGERARRGGEHGGAAARQGRERGARHGRGGGQRSRDARGHRERGRARLAVRRCGRRSAPGRGRRRSARARGRRQPRQLVGEPQAQRAELLPQLRRGRGGARLVLAQRRREGVRLERQQRHLAQLHRRGCGLTGGGRRAGGARLLGRRHVITTVVGEVAAAAAGRLQRPRCAAPRARPALPPRAGALRQRGCGHGCGPVCGAGRWCGGAAGRGRGSAVQRRGSVVVGHGARAQRSRPTPRRQRARAASCHKRAPSDLTTPPTVPTAAPAASPARSPINQTRQVRPAGVDAVLRSAGEARYESSVARTEPPCAGVRPLGRRARAAGGGARPPPAGGAASANWHAPRAPGAPRTLPAPRALCQGSRLRVGLKGAWRAEARHAAAAAARGRACRLIFQSGGGQGTRKLQWGRRVATKRDSRHAGHHAQEKGGRVGEGFT